jgi:serine/threonine protein kinase
MIENDPSRFAEMQRLYAKAKSIQDQDQRQAFLLEQCAGDVELLAELDRLLAARDAGEQGVLQRARNHMSGIDRQLPPFEQLRSVFEAEVKGRDASGQSRVGSSLDGKAFPRIDRFEIVHVLGQGGMGTVYLAQQQQPVTRPVAIKVIKPGMDSEQVIRRFEAEKQILASFNHPNIAKLYDAGITHGGYPFFAMEWIQGVSITEYCRSQSLGLAERLEIFLDVCAAVSHAHEKNIIHRDLKPSNLMVTVIDRRPVAKVIDFGVCKAIGPELNDGSQFTNFAELIGTPLYISPEQVAFSRQPLQPATDVFALATVLFELVTGETPIDRHDLKQCNLEGLRRLIMESAPEAPSKLLRRQAKEKDRQAAIAKHDATGPEESPATEELQVVTRQPPPISASELRDLDWVVLKGLAKKPEDRYPTVEAFADDVRRFLNDQPVLAAAPPVWHRSRKWLARHHRVVAAAILACLILGSLVFLKNLEGEPNQFDVGNHDAVTDASERGLTEDSDRKDRKPSDSFFPPNAADDYREAALLQSMVAAVRQSNLAALRQFELPRQPNGEFLGSDTADGSGLSSGPSLRDFLTKVARPDPLQTLSHPAGVSDLSVSSDERYLATSCDDLWFRIWDLESGREVAKFGPAKGAMGRVVFSDDDALLACGDQEGFVSIWDLRWTGNRDQPVAVTKRFESPEGETGVESLAWSPDGSRLAVGYRYGLVHVLDSAGVAQFRTVADEPRSRNYSVLFDVQGEHLFASNLSERRLEKWNIESGQCVGNWPDPSGQFIHFAHCEVEGKNLILAECLTQGFCLIDPQTMQLAALLRGRQKDAEDLCVFPDSTIFATSDRTGLLDLFDLAVDPKDGNLSILMLGTIAFSDEILHRPSIKFISDARLITADSNGAVQTWRIEQFDPFRMAITQSLFACVTQLEDEQLVVSFHGATETDASEMRIVRYTAASDFYRKNFVKIFTSQTGFFGRPFNEKSPASYVLTNAAASVIFFVLDDGFLVASKEMELLGDFSSPRHKVKRCGISADGRIVAVGYENGEYDILESTSDYKNFVEFKLPTIISEEMAGGQIYPLPIFPDGGNTLMLLSQSDILEFDLKNRTVIRRWPRTAVHGLAVSPDESLLALSSRDHGIEVFVRKTGNRIFQSRSDTAGVFIFCDSNRILLTSNDYSRVEAIHLPTEISLGPLYVRSTQRVEDRFPKPFVQIDNFLKLKRKYGDPTILTLGRLSGRSAR